MRAADVQAQCQVVRDTVLLNPDYVENARTMSVVVGADTVLVWFARDSIREIDVLSDRPQTSDSLRVGMRLYQLRRIAGLTAISGEASTEIEVPRHCGIGLRVIGAPGMGEDGADADEAAIRSWPDTIRVNAIRVSGC